MVSPAGLIGQWMAGRCCVLYSPSPCPFPLRGRGIAGVLVRSMVSPAGLIGQWMAGRCCVLYSPSPCPFPLRGRGIAGVLVRSMVSPAGLIGQWMTGGCCVLYSPSPCPLPLRGRGELGDFEVGVGALYGSAVGEEEAGDLLLGCAGDGRDLGVLSGEEAVRVGEARRQGGDYEVVAVEGD